MEKLRANKVRKNKKETTVQTRLAGRELEDLELVKTHFGFKTDSQASRFLIVRTADNIRNGKPLSIIPQM